MTNITTKSTIEICRTIFAIHGFSQYFVSDNDTQFTSKEFKTFLQENEIKQKLSAPYHPATNGQAERFVQILKNSFYGLDHREHSLNHKLCNLLMQYRKMPHMGTGQSPSMLLMSREIRSRLDCIKPNINKDKTDTIQGTRNLEIGKRVACRNYSSDKWSFGEY